MFPIKTSFESSEIYVIYFSEIVFVTAEASILKALRFYRRLMFHYPIYIFCTNLTTYTIYVNVYLKIYIYFCSVAPLFLHIILRIIYILQTISYNLTRKWSYVERVSLGIMPLWSDLYIISPVYWGFMFMHDIICTKINPIAKGIKTMENIFRPEHPNPQFQRKSWMNLT